MPAGWTTITGFIDRLLIYYASNMSAPLLPADEDDDDTLVAEDGVALVTVLAALREGFRCRSCKFLMRPPLHLLATN
eukprot:SAG11_NODE_33258_length_278_cov_0.860335_1_plen_76_part_10